MPRVPSRLSTTWWTRCASATGSPGFARFWNDSRDRTGIFLRTLAATVAGAYVPSLYRHELRDGSLKQIVPIESDIPFPVRRRVDDQDSWIHGYDGAYIPFSNEDTEETLPLASDVLTAAGSARQAGHGKGSMYPIATNSGASLRG